ncbi:MAG TPA: alpha/beta hydrolase [Ilumatobacter sp.]|nr:alpha/beta hydrolase [Ilumatobacter sp.]
MTGNTTTVRHNHIDLALHQLQSGSGRPLLLLHGLGERSPDQIPTDVRGWAGPVFALDFTGHGASTLPRAGGYTAEILMADVDAALAHIGPSTVVGRGLGAYIALLISGGRPELVHGAVLTDGGGMAGGSTEPTSITVLTSLGRDTTPDPYALLELGRDLRPPDYASEYAAVAVAGSLAHPAITVTAQFRPSWLEAVVATRGVATAASTAAALAAYAES